MISSNKTVSQKVGREDRKEEFTEAQEDDDIFGNFDETDEKPDFEVSKFNIS